MACCWVLLLSSLWSLACFSWVLATSRRCQRSQLGEEVQSGRMVMTFVSFFCLLMHYQHFC